MKGMVKAMKSISEMYAPVKSALLSVSDNVGKFEAIDATKTHIVYGFDTEGSSLASDDTKAQQVLQGTIDLYALPADEKMFDDIQKALNDAEISFAFSSATFEEQELNDFVHYQWIFEVS